MKRLKLAFIWESATAGSLFPFWKDGYRAALELVSIKHDLDYYIGTAEKIVIPENKYDVLMYWGGSQDKYHDILLARKERKLWLYPGGGIDPKLPENYNVVFTEDKYYEEQLKTMKTRVIRVTGTNSELFKPKKEDKHFKAFFPATFSLWKNQHLFARAIGKDGLCSGTIQPDGKELVAECIKLGTKVIIGYLPAECLVTLYNMSETVVLPVTHGSQRTLLEALSMNIPCVVGNHFAPIVDLAEEIGGCQITGLEPFEIREAWQRALRMRINTRPYVIHEYGEKQFAEKLLRGIEDR